MPPLSMKWLNRVVEVETNCKIQVAVLSSILYPDLTLSLTIKWRLIYCVNNEVTHNTGTVFTVWSYVDRVIKVLACPILSIQSVNRTTLYMKLIFIFYFYYFLVQISWMYNTKIWWGKDYFIPIKTMGHMSLVEGYCLEGKRDNV